MSTHLGVDLLFHKQSTLFLVIFFSLKMTFSYINVGIWHLFWLMFKLYLFFNISNFNLCLYIWCFLQAVCNWILHFILFASVWLLIWCLGHLYSIWLSTCAYFSICPICSHYAFLLFLSFFYDCIFISLFLTYWLLHCYFCFSCCFRVYGMYV